MKKPFLLLEVLIALLLVSLCLIPLIRSPVENYRTEMRQLEEMEGERLADITFAEIKEKLAKHEIAWDRLPAPGTKTAPFPLPSLPIHIPGCKEKKIERAFTLRCDKRGEKQGPHGEITRIVKVDVSFTPQLSQKKKQKDHSEYSYRVILQLRDRPVSKN